MGGASAKGRMIPQMPHTPVQGNTIGASRDVTVESLRGLASLAVCWFHLTNGNPAFLRPGLLKDSGRFGWLGVEVFFVISGFVMPLSMEALGYSPKHVGRFLARRVIRLDPPYLATIALILVADAVSRATPGYQGTSLAPDLTTVALHLGYLNAFFGRPWLSPVFWTLALEFQWYVLVAIAYPALASRRTMLRVALATMTVAPLLATDRALLPVWLPLFEAGILAYLVRNQRIGSREFAVWLLLTCVSVGSAHGTAVVAVIAATALLLASGWQLPALAGLGSLSYSLYLLHVPIGGRIVNLGCRLAPDAVVRAGMLIVALGVSLLAAWVLFRSVEKPAIRWSRRIQLARPRLAPQEGTGPAAASRASAARIAE